MKITFSPKPGEIFNIYDRLSFWNHPETIQWFEDRGYTLYQSPDITSKPALKCDLYAAARYPYAYHNHELFADIQSNPLCALNLTGKVAFAQNKATEEHVVIKLVRQDTDKYQILSFLHNQQPQTLETHCIISVLDLLECESHYGFAVMPRWGDSIFTPSFQKLSDVVDFVHSALKALVFLHDNNIAHGDIHADNFLVNHFCDALTIFKSQERPKLRSERRLLYALYDFDFSTIIPSPNVAMEGFRLPYWRSWGTFNVSKDTAAGEFDYSPFAMDVGSLGVLFCDKFQTLAGTFPALAPLLDMMSSWDVTRRFTAREALEFFETHATDLSPEQLGADIQPFLPSTSSAYDVYDRWQHLPLSLHEKWSAYRTPPLPWYKTCLYSICNQPVMRHIVPWIRWLFTRTP